MLAASVVICTHNPRPHYLSRVLNALRLQTLDKDHWELLVVDNLSDQRVADTWDLSWHPHARHIHEPELGQGPARRRGMQEAKSHLVVFVDDDNLLATDYLEVGLALEREWPQLGTWGSATTVPEYEVQPEERFAPLLPLLALRKVDTACWTNMFQIDACPWGAGMFIRRQVADAYLDHCRGARLQIAGRRGTSPVGGHGGEEVEMSFVACSLGMGIGIFPELKLTHLIPRERVTEDYLLKLHNGSSISRFLLMYKWQGANPGVKLESKFVLSFVKNLILTRGIKRKMYFSILRARRSAAGILKRSSIALPGG
jgi:glycosyltransferase involved in cell wall biosynthesis